MKPFPQLLHLFYFSNDVYHKLRRSVRIQLPGRSHRLRYPLLPHLRIFRFAFHKVSHLCIRSTFFILRMSGILLSPLDEMLTEYLE